MPTLSSVIDPSSDEFRRNCDKALQGVNALRAIERKALDKANSARARYAERGQLLPRERLSLLLDKGASFLELSSVAGFMMDGDTDGTGAGGGIIAGIGQVSGTRCLILIDNFAVKGGTITPAGLEKKLRFQQIALENKLPIVTLAQSGGADLRFGASTFVVGARYFATRARLSAAGIPQITVVHGSATAGGAYDPGLSDYIIMVRGNASMYLAGPPLLKAATGEIATEEELGGAEMHCQHAGTGDFLAENDADGIRIARNIVQCLHWDSRAPQANKKQFVEPLYAAEELIGIVPADTKQPYDVREVVARIADGSEFLDFKPEYDSGTVCGYFAVQGHPVGLIGNNSPITARGAAKAAQFIQLCDQSRIPILFLHNTTGFLVGTEQERDGIIKHGSKLIQAVANARVPRISIVIGGSYGAGNYAMCGRGLDPRFIFSWPSSRVAVMGGPQAGMVMKIVAERKFEQRGAQMDAATREKTERDAKEVEDILDKASDVFYSSARLWDDGIIDPRDTRAVLALLLDMCECADQRTLHPNTFGVARF